MLVAFNPTTEEILKWELPAEGALKTYLPARCPADCCDIDCGCAEDDPACTHSEHAESGQCVVKIALEQEDALVYTCLGQIPRGCDLSDCAHATEAECTCGRIEEYQARIAVKHGPTRRAGRQKEKLQGQAHSILDEAQAKKEKRAASLLSQAVSDIHRGPQNR